MKMDTQEMRKAFGMRLKALRKGKRWRQKEAAAKVGVGFSQYTKYESGIYMPPADKIVLLAEIFTTTTDYLLTGDNVDTCPMHNVRLYERFKALENLRPEDQEAVLRLVDAMIVKQRVEGALTPLDNNQQA